MVTAAEAPEVKAKSTVEHRTSNPKQSLSAAEARRVRSLMLKPGVEESQTSPSVVKSLSAEKAEGGRSLDKVQLQKEASSRPGSGKLQPNDVRYETLVDRITVPLGEARRGAPRVRAIAAEMVEEGVGRGIQDQDDRSEFLAPLKRVAKMAKVAPSRSRRGRRAGCGDGRWVAFIPHH